MQCESSDAGDASRQVHSWTGIQDGSNAAKRIYYFETDPAAGGGGYLGLVKQIDQQALPSGAIPRR